MNVDNTNLEAGMFTRFMSTNTDLTFHTIKHKIVLKGNEC